jgi:uncharacterized FlaG/YvyC family protein
MHPGNITQVKLSGHWPSGTLPTQGVFPGYRQSKGEAENLQNLPLNNLSSIAAGLHNFLDQKEVSVEFRKKEGTREVVARVINDHTGEVLLEYPVIVILKILCGINQEA